LLEKGFHPEGNEGSLRKAQTGDFLRVTSVSFVVYAFAGMPRHWFRIGNRSAREASMLRIIVLVLVVIAAVLLVPRLLSSSAKPSEGSIAPDFTLPSQDGSSVRLKDYRGKWVVLYFYPKDQTPG
jgi:hypothetical protein